MKRNNIGFTLVEIIVSIAIGSIVLLIAGAMILSSSGFLDSTVETDLNKRKIDSIIDFVRDEIIYATDVRYVQQDNKYVPDYQNDSNWHYFYVKDGRLYRDGTLLFDDGYYGVGKSLSMSVKGYDSAQRLDIKYGLSDNKETLYSSRDTIELMNLSISDDIKKDGLYTRDYIETSESGYWLFYNKTYKEPTVIPDEATLDKDGTVADIRYNINANNFGGCYDPKNKSFYSWSDFQNIIVWYEGYWWERTNNWAGEAPGYGDGWKRLSRYYTNPTMSDTDQKYSSYQMNDIVIYNDNYYRAIQDVDQCDNWFIITNKSYFEKLGSIFDVDVQKRVKEIGIYTPKSSFSNNDSILKKYLPENISMIDASNPTINGKQIRTYTDTQQYKEGDIVKVAKKDNDGYFDLYIKKLNFNINMGPGNAASGWIKLDILFDKNSSYLKDDSVALYGTNKYWIQATQNIVVETVPEQPLIGIHDTCLYWKKYQ